LVETMMHPPVRRVIATSSRRPCDCKSPVDEGFDRERHERIRRMRDKVEIPPFVKGPDGSIGPATD